MRLCRSTFLRVAFGSSARLRQNGFERISSTSRYDVIWWTTGISASRHRSKNSRFHLNDSLLRTRSYRHRGHLWIEVATMQINGYNRRLNLVDPERHTSSFRELLALDQGSRKQDQLFLPHSSTIKQFSIFCPHFSQSRNSLSDIVFRNKHGIGRVAD